MSESVVAGGPWFAIAVTMVHTLWVGAVVGAAAVASRLALRQASAGVRYGVALAWLGTLALVPVGTGLWVASGLTDANGHITAVKAEPAAAPRPVPAPAAGTRDGANALPLAALDDAASTDAVPTREPVAGWLVRWRSVASVLPAIWMVGAAAMLAWSLMGLVGAERLRRGAARAGADLEQLVTRLSRQAGVRSVGVMLCTRVGSPVLVGIIRPVILLPAAMVAELSPAQLEMILTHELAHVRRWDNLVNLLQRVIESVLFFQPAVWVVSAWVRQEREHCCDDAVIAAGGTDRHEYAEVLLGITQLCGRLPPAASAASGGNLASRVRHLITRRDSMRVSRTCVVALVIPAVLSGVWLAWAAAPGEGKVLTVAKDGSEYKTIQSAIDAAPEGATVRIGPGVWEEGLVLKKGVTLEGAGWDRTTLMAAVPAEAREAAKELARQVDKGISLTEWKSRVDALSQKYQTPAVIRVEAARGVVVRGLKVAGSPGSNPDGTLMPQIALMTFDRSAGRVENCVVAGSPGNGINISGGSDVQVAHTLVAGVWSTGIQVGSRDGAPSKVLISDSDVRNCYHRCVVIGPGQDVTVEGCRIWGTAWHCIRYDDASPTIRNNRFFNSARFGIYASGKTHATVTGNLFLHCEMEGMSCWFANQDNIEGNTFVSNLRGGLTILGASKPAITRNLFVGQPVAISCSFVNGQPSAPPSPTLDGNWFWENQADLQKSTGKEMVKADLAPETRSRTEKVQFADTAKGDYSLPADSPARAAKVGAADPLSEASPFPTQVEEKTIMPDGGSWDYQKWKKG